MARPMTATQFVDLLDKWGIPHRENRKGWATHNRDDRIDGWGITEQNPTGVHGIGNHHTGGHDDKTGRDILWNGYGDLPGPLCHAGIQTDGHVLLNGWGRVNHFGAGDPNVLNHVINEDYTGRLIPHIAQVDGNARFYGFEWMYDGLHEPETTYPKLYHTAVRLNAAICTWHKWTFKSAISHGEWQPGKWDPGHANGQLFDVVRFRRHVDQAMQEGPKPPPSKPATKQITVVQGDTLQSIATKYGETLAALIIANPQLLQPGMKLTVPNK